MPTGWTIRSGDNNTKLYAIILENGNVIAGSLVNGTTIPGPTIQNQATISSGVFTAIAYDGGVIDIANRHDLVTLSTGWGQDANQPGSLFFYANEAGPVLTLTLTAGGNYYTVAPTVSFVGDCDRTAAATATLSTAGSVIGVTVTGGGTGYTTGDPVTFTGGGGSGAAGTAVCSIFGVILSVTMVSHGSGYTSAPTPVFGGAGMNATGTSSIGFPVASLDLTDAGLGYTALPTVTITGNGSGATAAVTAIGTPLAAGDYGVLLSITNDQLNQVWPASWTIPLKVTAGAE